LDAFVYDATVLEYLVSQDEDCKLLTVGGWYSDTGYGVAFPKGSKYLTMFNRKLLEYRVNGDIERLSRFWLTGVCRPQQRKRSSSNSLTPKQFLSAFVLLTAGIVFAFWLLALEKIYFNYCRKRLVGKVPRLASCCALISLVSINTKSNIEYPLFIVKPTYILLNICFPYCIFVRALARP
jgi:ionotropic glutamate receptor NMDA 2B